MIRHSFNLITAKAAGPAGPGKLQPYFLKLASDFIAPPLTHIFNLSLVTDTIALIWKSTHVTPLLKGATP